MVGFINISLLLGFNALRSSVVAARTAHIRVRG
jgi:hypothetical protein